MSGNDGSSWNDSSGSESKSLLDSASDEEEGVDEEARPTGAVRTEPVEERADAGKSARFGKMAVAM